MTTMTLGGGVGRHVGIYARHSWRDRERLRARDLTPQTRSTGAESPKPGRHDHHHHHAEQRGLQDAEIGLRLAGRPAPAIRPGGISQSIMPLV